jgi:branched-chain amino acid transport system substrate-binding protein
MANKLSKKLSLYCILVILFLFMTDWMAYGTNSQSVRIALIIAKTGKAKVYSKPVLEGAMIALHEINANGGLLGIPLEMIVIDNHSTPIGSQIAAKKAVAQNVHGVIGSIWSSHSMPVAKIMQKAKKFEYGYSGNLNGCFFIISGFLPSTYYCRIQQFY